MNDSTTPSPSGFAADDLAAAQRDAVGKSLTRGARGEIRPTLDNVCRILEYDSAWKDLIAYNEFSGMIVKRRGIDGELEPGDWSDIDDIFLQRWIARVYGFEPKKQVVVDAVQLIAHRNRWHPVREYLEGLKWDRRPRLRYWLGAYLGAVPFEPVDGDDVVERKHRFQRYLHVVGVKWMVAAVARIFEPGCKADYVLILEGPQRRGKSTALRILAGDEWFLDTPFRIGTADGYEVLRGSWIVELAELDALNRAESSAAKAFFSGQRDKYRRAYGRHAQRVPRQCVFAGTVNPAYYLKDETGNTRYWPVHCDRLELYGEDGLAPVRDQLWAEAVVYYRRGLRWWPSEREWELIHEEVAKREVGDAWEELIRSWLDETDPTVGKRDTVTMDEILGKALSLDPARWTRAEQVRAGNIMQRLGWSRHRGPRGWFYRRPSTLYKHPDGRLGGEKIH